MELIPLGTSSATIVQERGLSAYVLRSGQNLFLFDCGDGTQFRLQKAGLRISRIKAVFISHLHGDHYYGLFGLLTTMSLAQRRLPLTIVAPWKLADILRILPGELCFEIEHVRLEEGFASEAVYREHGLQVYARPLDHGGEICVGYRVEKRSGAHQIHRALANAYGLDRPEQFQKLAAGASVQTAAGKIVTPDQVKKPACTIFAYATDTRPCTGTLELAKDADLLVHEATFSQKEAERARVTGHSTAVEAALQAKAARSQKLLLTHFSSRYPDVTLLRREAEAVFPNTSVAREYQIYFVRSHKPLKQSSV